MQSTKILLNKNPIPNTLLECLRDLKLHKDKRVVALKAKNNFTEIDGQTLTIEDVISVARHHMKVKLSASSYSQMKKSRAIVENAMKSKKIVYGVTTGFGKLRNKFISADTGKKLQENLIKSHAFGVGDIVEDDIVRAIMLIRANTLAKGFSGIRPEVVERILFYLNEEIIPLIPEKGSVGASGDLVPLAHLALSLTGSGKVRYRGKIKDVSTVLDELKKNPIKLTYKEGLALINGTAFMMGYASLAYYDAVLISKYADIAAALSLEALLANSNAFDEKLMNVRPIAGQIATADNIRKLIKDSKLINSKIDKVQDAYSLRCIPQVHAPVKDTLNFVKRILTVELNSANDNPLIFPEGSIISGGNFHGEPIAVAMDYLSIAMNIIGNISERRIARLIDDTANEGLPIFLIDNKKAGLNSGYMIPQYVAAALVSENKILAHPASVDSIPTSANFEDFVSMGSIAARKCYEIVKNTRKIIAIELLLASQAIDFRGHEKLGIGTKIAYQAVRDIVPKLVEDRIGYEDLNKVESLIKDNFLLKRIEEKIGCIK